MDPEVVDLIQDFVGTGFGALFGAWCAFRFERRQKRIEEKAAQVAGVRKALFTLIIQRSFLENFIALYLEPRRDDPHRWRTLQRYLALPIHEELSLDGLSFLLEVRASNLLNQLAHGQNQFRTLLGVLEARNAAYQTMLDRVTESTKTPSSALAAENLEAVLGPEVVEPLRGLTEALYDATSFARYGNEEDIRGVGAFFNAKFPGEHLPEVHVHPAKASR